MVESVVEMITDQISCTKTPENLLLFHQNSRGALLFKIKLNTKPGLALLDLIQALNSSW